MGCVERAEHGRHVSLYDILQRRPVELGRVKCEGHGRHVYIPDFTSRRDEIGELSRDLRGMTEALWQRMDAIEKFAADVSHEIKNPLTSLRSAVETVARIDDPEKQKKLMIFRTENSEMSTFSTAF